MARLRFTYQDRGLEDRIRAIQPRMHTGVGAIVDYYALQGMAYMKTNAPWTDRTGAARTGLHTVTEHAGTTHTITFAHAVNYGIWLEVKYSGRDAIIMPAVRHIGDRLEAAFAGLMRRI